MLCLKAADDDTERALGNQPGSFTLVSTHLGEAANTRASRPRRLPSLLLTQTDTILSTPPSQGTKVAAPRGFRYIKSCIVDQLSASSASVSTLRQTPARKAPPLQLTQERGKKKVLFL